MYYCDVMNIEMDMADFLTGILLKFHEQGLIKLGIGGYFCG